MVDGAVATSAPIYAQIDFKGKNTMTLLHMKIVSHDINSHILRPKLNFYLFPLT